MRGMIKVLGLLTVLLPLIAAPASAQGPGPRPVRIIVNAPPGSSIDLVARAIAEPMSQDGGGAVVVDNRPGGAGTVASEAVARATANGQTLLISGLDAIVFAFVAANRKPFDPLTDFTPVGRITRDHWLLAVSPDLGVSSVAELIALARAKPGTLSYASMGTGSSVHLMGARFAHGAGIEAVPVPYKESYVPDLMAGRVSYVVHVTAAVGPQIRAGKLKGLAVFSNERIPYLPDVPSIVEAGLPDLVFNAGLVVYAPGGTPRALIAVLNRRVNQALAGDSVRQRFAELGLDATPGSSDDAAKYVRENLARLQSMRETTFGR